MLKQIMTNPKEIVFEEVSMPIPEDNQVLVKIMNIGVCGSDIHVYHGKHPFTSYPVTQGHEVSGVITELGKHVKGLVVGQKVTIEPQVFCGKCYLCRHGKYNLYFISIKPQTKVVKRTSKNYYFLAESCRWMRGT